MDKKAKEDGERGIFNKLEEMTNLSGLRENTPFLKQKGLKEVMDILRKADDNIRSIVVGKSIGESNIELDGTSLKHLITEAKKNINRREYIIAISFLGRFHEKIEQINELGNDFNSEVVGMHDKLIFDGLDDETKAHLKKLHKKFAMQKEAGIRDFLANIFSARGQALKYWEKTYPNQIKKLKNETNAMFNRSEALYNTILASLGKLGSFRAVRQVDLYVDNLKNICQKLSVYDKAFEDFYKANVKGFLDRLPQPKEEGDMLAPRPTILPPESVKPATVPQGPASAIFAPMSLGPRTDAPIQNLPESALDFDLGPRVPAQPQRFEGNSRPTLPSAHIEQMRNAPVEVAPTEEIAVSPAYVAAPNPVVPVSVVNKPVEPTPPSAGQQARDLARAERVKPRAPATHAAPAAPKAPPPLPTSAPVAPQPPEGINLWEMGLSADDGFTSHAEFYSLLDKLANTQPEKMASFIKKYAQAISSTDVATSIQLLKIAKSIGG